MPLYFISGRPGGGKSLYSIRLIVHELVHGNRPIVTNSPLCLGPLAVYLEKQYPTVDVVLHERVRILSREETKTFWRCRGPRRGNITAATVTDSRGVQDVTLENPDDDGVFYVIDELHEFFNSHEWAAVGKEAIHYLSQHRRWRDDIIAITQSVGNVAKQFRVLAQDYTTVRNLSKEKMGKFRLPGVFLRTTYLNPPTGSANDRAMESGTFRLDVTGLASCYDTAQGVGVHGKMADKGTRARGLHPAWLAALVLLGGVLLYYSPNMVNRALSFGSMGKAKLGKAKAAVAEADGTAAYNRARTIPPSAGGGGPYHVLWWTVLSYPDRKGPEYTFALSDGRRLKNPLGAVWTGDALQFEGKRWTLYTSPLPLTSAGGPAPTLALRQPGVTPKGTSYVQPQP